MERSSFLKGLFTGAIGLATIPAYAQMQEKPKVKKLTDEQLSELYDSYLSLKKIEDSKSLQLQKQIEKDLYEVNKQNEIIPSIRYINKCFSYKSVNRISNFEIKKHIKKLENYRQWQIEYKTINKNYITCMHQYDLDYVKLIDINITLIKGHILCGALNKAEELYSSYIKERSGGYVTMDSYGIIYYADLLFSKGYHTEALGYYQQSNQENIKRFITKLENGDKCIDDFNKRYYHKAYFGNMYSDLIKKGFAK